MKILAIALAVTGQILFSPIPAAAAFDTGQPPIWFFRIAAERNFNIAYYYVNDTRRGILGSDGVWVSDIAVPGTNTISFSRAYEGGATWALSLYQEGIFSPVILHLEGSYHCGSPGEEACGSIVPLVSFDLFGGTASAYAVPAPAMGGPAALLAALVFLRRRRL